MSVYCAGDLYVKMILISFLYKPTFNSHPLSCQSLINELSISHGRADLHSAGNLSARRIVFARWKASSTSHGQPALSANRQISWSGELNYQSEASTYVRSDGIR